MSQNIRIGPNPRLGFGPFLCSRWMLAGLVVLGGIEGYSGDELAGGGVDDSDAQVLDEHQIVGWGVGSSDADVV